ncbi:MAG: CpsB/CapC family capsule biosynthesis tyrosine phosphatase [Bacillota bacterium]|nr:CpsB/CapC family capsule biosynthesis tyrosine phosphatase [Bacillota bacterium]
MIDIHSHIIFDADDGPTSIKESMRMVLEAEKLGIKTIIATPHFKKNAYKIENYDENFKELKKRLAGCNIELMMGYEVFFDSILTECLNNKSMYTLNNSKYLLFEFPFDIYPKNALDIILKLHSNDIIPIIAHPERYSYFQRDFNMFLNIVEAGCMVQIDSASIVGYHGRKVKALSKKIIKHGLAHFVASDAHSSDAYTKWFMESYDKVRDWVGNEYAKALFIHNQEMILTND